MPSTVKIKSSSLKGVSVKNIEGNLLVSVQPGRPVLLFPLVGNTFRFSIKNYGTPKPKAIAFASFRSSSSGE